ncbi:MAG TPA: BamA/TamA family outer membrane protein [Kofleriaceae bacterium]|nr:BamA/TamA family outer membrane protein [Kofleriaceae bacterium]
MRSRRAVFIAMMLLAVGRSAAAQPAPEKDEPQLTTPVWREPPPPLELGWHVMALPEYVVELAFTPFAFAVGLVEKYRLDQRVYDLLRNDAGTVKVVPAAKFSGGDGFGVGAGLDLENLAGHGEEFDVGGLVRLNRDWQARARYRQSYAALEGRQLTAEVEVELDHDLKFFGLGNEARLDDKRLVRDETLLASAEMDLFRLPSYGINDVGGRVLFGYRRTQLGPGEDSGPMPTPPLGEPGDTVEPTGDFGRTSDWALGQLSLFYDSRDTVARTTRGVLLEVEPSVTAGVNRADLGAATGKAEVTVFVPVLPLRRVLVARLGAAAVAPLTSEDQVPLADYVLLDRRHGLRGYTSGRFRDRYGWWSTLEYRYPIYEFQDSGVALSPALFVDAGRVASRPREMFESKVRWDVGAGLRLEHETAVILLIELGVSPEGTELGFTVGKNL